MTMRRSAIQEIVSLSTVIIILNKRRVGSRMARGAILIIHLIIASSGNVLITFALWYKFQPVGNTGRRILCMMGNEQQLSLSLAN
ncbi:Uncharacterised protein [Salmonella enterica subsp. enterica]|uniref:Uncharacterized protein n=1 Tax=Salmonella enterica I TaxID=59201 RepID=A0A447PP07_SALET|nr:Uncharacterised protein [Salmonella enterica subsp. enterica]